MDRKPFFLFFALLAAFALMARHVFAKPQQQTITTPQQLMNVVNQLRASRGLSMLAEHPALMQSAQAQANYMASTGNVTHERPGTTYTQQLLALGFPLAGDLTLGGFRSENIISSNGPLVWDGVPPGWQDDAHMNTMISPNYTHFGAGIATNGNTYYYALDAAAATSSGQMQQQASAILTSVPSNPNAAGVSQYIIPVALATAEPNGDVYHVVQYGQTLWAIAIAYDTKIKELQALNNLGESIVVQQGQKLLVKRGATQPAPQAQQVTPTAMMTTTPMVVTATPFVIASPQVTAALPTAESNLPAQQPPASNQSASDNASRVWVALLILASFVGGGMAVWLIRDPNP